VAKSNIRPEKKVGDIEKLFFDAWHLLAVTCKGSLSICIPDSTTNSDGALQ
jgi:hypothetical protein